MAVTDTHPAAIGRPVLRAPRAGQALAATDTARGRPGDLSELAAKLAALPIATASESVAAGTRRAGT